jgi:signal transduction histidine kinase
LSRKPRPGVRGSGDPQSGRDGTTTARSAPRLPSQTLLWSAALVAWTVAIVVVPDLRSSYEAPRLRLILSAISVGSAAFAAALAAVRFGVDGSRRWLFVSLGFGVIAVNQAIFGLVFEPGTIGLEHPAYLWLTARLNAGVLLVVAAYTSGVLRSNLARTYTSVAAVCFAALAVVQLVVFAFDERLPALVSGDADVTVITGAAPPDLTPTGFALAVIGVVLFCAAAWGTLTRSSPHEPIYASLASVFVIAGFAHVHYAMAPTMFTTRVSTGDILRLLMSVVLVAALIADVRRSYMRERHRAIELADAYEAQRDRVRSLEELERTKANLLRMLAHELLHPVAVIRTLATGLVNGASRLDDDARGRAIEAILGQSEQLRDLVENAPELESLRIDAAPDRKSHRVADLVDDVSRTFPHMSGRLSISLERCADGAVVSVNRGRMMQVFHNLLSNAERFAPGGSPIVLSVGCAANEVVFRVRDVGPGIPADESERLFDPFVRLANAPTGDGTGIGLHIVRSVVEAHGGRVWVEPVTEPGASVAFSLPRQAGT